MKYTGTSTRASCHVYCIKHEDFSCYNYVFYITTTPYLPCNNKNINRKKLYDFYYTAITLTTGYKFIYNTNQKMNFIILNMYSHTCLGSLLSASSFLSSSLASSVHPCRGTHLIIYIQYTTHAYIHTSFNSLVTMTLYVFVPSLGSSCEHLAQSSSVFVRSSP